MNDGLHLIYCSYLSDLNLASLFGFQLKSTSITSYLQLGSKGSYGVHILERNDTVLMPQGQLGFQGCC